MPKRKEQNIGAGNSTLERQIIQPLLKICFWLSFL